MAVQRLTLNRVQLIYLEQNHFDNLADILPEENLEPIGNDMVQNYMDYKSSRKDWENAYTTGLDLLGFKYENRTEPFKEHPVQHTQFLLKQSHSFKHKLTKNYYLQMDLLEQLLLVLKSTNRTTSRSCKRFHELFNYGSNARIRIRV